MYINLTGLRPPVVLRPMDRNLAAFPVALPAPQQRLEIFGQHLPAETIDQRQDVEPLEVLAARAVRSNVVAR